MHELWPSLLQSRLQFLAPSQQLGAQTNHIELWALGTDGYGLLLRHGARSGSQPTGWQGVHEQLPITFAC